MTNTNQTQVTSLSKAEIPLNNYFLANASWFFYYDIILVIYQMNLITYI